MPRVRPSTAPRAVASHSGAPRPVKAGTTTTPPESPTEPASALTSGADAMIFRPSRSHWMAAPPENTLPSSA